jgi:acetyltransferase-like isoleucine patch superfamily enzyme
MLVNQTNQGFETTISTTPYLRMAVGATLVHTQIVDNVTIDKFSCVSRSELGRYFGLGCFSFVNNSLIGRYCTFGARISVGAFSHPTNWLSIHEFQYRDTSNIYGDSILEGGVNIAPKNAQTQIGNDVWIGDNACVRAGTKIEDGVIVGMGAVVTADVPPYAIVGGSPARVLRYRFDKAVITALLELKWWELEMNDLKNVDFSDVHGAIAIIRQRRDAQSS